MPIRLGSLFWYVPSSLISFVSQTIVDILPSFIRARSRLSLPLPRTPNGQMMTKRLNYQREWTVITTKLRPVGVAFFPSKPAVPPPIARGMTALSWRVVSTIAPNPGSMMMRVTPRQSSGPPVPSPVFDRRAPTRTSRRNIRWCRC